jgi:tetratricopeptide (TPR) repeat protein
MLWAGSCLSARPSSTKVQLLHRSGGPKGRRFFLVWQPAKWETADRMTQAATPSAPVGSPPVLREVVLNLNHGDVPKATALACEALGRGETHPLFLNLRAARREQEGQSQAALSDLLLAHEMAPDDAPVSNALGLALMKAGQHFDAMKAFAAAVKAAPRFAPAHFNKATACEAMGYLDEAQRCFSDAAALDDRAAEPLARLAALAARRGDFAEARRAAGEAMARQPDHLLAIRALTIAECDTGSFSEADGRIRNMLRRPDLAPYDRYITMGLLGDLREREGRYADAFTAYAEGNKDYYRATRPHFAETAAASLQWLTDYYANPALLTQAPARTASAGCSHVFLLGFPRSGTTLLEQVLAMHPQVVTMEEKDAFAESVRAFMAGPEQHATLAKLSADQLEPYREAYWRRVGEFGFSPGTKVFIDKHPLHTVKLPLIAALFPRAKILLAIRDPRDVVLSCLRARFRMNPYMIELLRLQDAAAFYANMMRLAESYRDKLALTVREVRHEELVSDFDKTCHEVCAFLGLEWTGSMRDFASRARAVATPSARDIAHGLSRAGVGRWRAYASHLAPVMPVLAPWVSRLGYPDV